jgi:hypothetical protein
MSFVIIDVEPQTYLPLVDETWNMMADYPTVTARSHAENHSRRSVHCDSGVLDG